MSAANGSRPAEHQPEYADKREYRDRAYAETKHELQHLYLYWIDRMEPRKDRDGYGWVLPGFATAYRVHKDTGLHEDTVPKLMYQLIKQNLIAIKRHKKPVKTVTTKKGNTTKGYRWVMDGIQVAPPGMVLLGPDHLVTIKEYEDSMARLADEAANA